MRIWFFWKRTVQNGCPAKFRRPHEPVLLPESDIVLGRGRGCPRGQTSAGGLLPAGAGLRPAGTASETLLTPELLAKLLASEQGERKLVGNRRFSVVLNQADAPARIAAGEQTLALLRKKYEVQGVLTYFDERERA